MKNLRMWKIQMKARRQSMLIPLAAVAALTSGLTVNALTYQQNKIIEEPSQVEISQNQKEDGTLTAGATQVMSEIIMKSDKLADKQIAKEKEQPKYKFEKSGYVTTTLNVREKPNTEANILGHLRFNDEVHYSNANKDWAAISVDNEIMYISRDYISDEKQTYQSKGVSGDRRKSYMDYRCIKARNSMQYKLQSQYGYTSSNGVRMVSGRYCIAVGSYYSRTVGQYLDLVLSDGTVIPCIIGDCKADKDTINGNRLGIGGDCAEFIVATGSLPHKVRQMGDCSYIDGMGSPVVEVRLYQENAFDL